MKKIFVLALLSAAAALATPVLTFDQSTGSSGTNQNQSVGWQFNVLQSLTVTGLGWFDEGQNGLATSHTVGIWNPAGTLLASLSIPAGTVAGLDGPYRMVSLGTPLVLAVGNGYIVGGENFGTSTDRLAFDVTQTVDSRILFIDATFSDIGSGFLRPTQFSSAANGFYGPMFAVSAASTSGVPEPTTVGFAALGLLLMGAKTLLRKN